MRRRLRLADLCWRYEIDKVIALLPNTDLKQTRLACEKLSRDMNLDDILDIQPYPGFCFQVSAGFAEVTDESQLEQVIAQIQSNQQISYEFRVC